MNGDGGDKSATRAPALSRRDKASADIRNLVTFRLGRQTCALPIEPIVQIIEMVTITPIPQVNHSVEGVINVRGAMVPVVNLRRHLGLPHGKLQEPEAPYGLHTPMILVRANGRMVGLIVDQVIDVLTLTASQVTRPADVLPDGLGDVPLLQGLVHTENGMVLLINLDRLFSLGQAQGLAQAMAALPTLGDSSGDGKSGQPGPASSGPEALEATQPGELEVRA